MTPSASRGHSKSNRSLSHPADTVATLTGVQLSRPVAGSLSAQTSDTGVTYWLTLTNPRRTRQLLFTSFKPGPLVSGKIWSIAGAHVPLGVACCRRCPTDASIRACMQLASPGVTVRAPHKPRIRTLCGPLACSNKDSTDLHRILRRPAASNPPASCPGTVILPECRQHGAHLHRRLCRCVVGPP